jgi:hypothetical protein
MNRWHKFLRRVAATACNCGMQAHTGECRHDACTLFINPKTMQAFIEGIGGTLLMTLFVNGISAVTGGSIRIVRVLGTMLLYWRPDRKLFSSPKTLIVGTIAHYAVGVLFAYAYHWLWQNGWASATFGGCTILGLLCGILAVIVWRIFMAVHPYPPITQKSRFLVIVGTGHLVFAWGVWLVLLVGMR